MKRIKSTIVFVFILAIILSSNREVYAMTPPSSDELREAYRYSVERSREIMQEPMENEELAEIVPILDNTDAFFVFQAMNISEIESEEQLSKLIDEANSDTIDQTNAIWVATQWNADDTYEELYFMKNENGVLEHPASGVTYDKNDLITTKISNLLGEQYNSSMKDLLVFGMDRTTPFGSNVLVKRFEDGSIRIGVLWDMDYYGFPVKSGFYTLEEIKEIISDYQKKYPEMRYSTPSNAENTAPEDVVYSGTSSTSKPTKYYVPIALIIFVALIVGWIIIYRKRSLKY